MTNENVLVYGAYTKGDYSCVNDIKLMVKAIACGFDHCVAITMGGKCMTFGESNDDGQLGINWRDNFDLFTLHTVELPNDEEVISVSCGCKHTVLLTKTNNLCAFGWNSEFQCGMGSVGGHSRAIVLPRIIDKKHELGLDDNERISAVLALRVSTVVFVE